jgi:hypothetical protein
MNNCLIDPVDVVLAAPVQLGGQTAISPLDHSVGHLIPGLATISVGEYTAAAVAGVVVLSILAPVSAQLPVALIVGTCCREMAL